MSILATPLGWLMEGIYFIVKNYGIALLLFTLVTKLALLPLSVKQQKSMARMSAYNPIIQDINKKYAKDKQKQQEEMMKLYDEYGFSPSMGCLPMVIQMVIMFGLIEVIYKPLRYIIGVPKEAYDVLYTWARAEWPKITYPDTAIIKAIQDGSSKTIEKVGEVLGQNGDKLIDGISNFDFTFLGMDLTSVPSIHFTDVAGFLLILIPILSAVTMILSQIIMTKASGQEMTGPMKFMPYFMSISFIFIGFTVPTGVSLYWIFSNIIGLVQSLWLKKIYDPEKMKQQVLDDIEEKKKAKRSKKKIAVTTESGATVEKEVTEGELASIRLAKARELAKQRYEE
ncbi:MAG: YidC/Oxa1 family membrane protein insertase [Oscillospiraceae bacterium]